MESLHSDHEEEIDIPEPHSATEEYRDTNILDSDIKKRKTVSSDEKYYDNELEEEKDVNYPHRKAGSPVPYPQEDYEGDNEGEFDIYGQYDNNQDGSPSQNEMQQQYYEALLKEIEELEEELLRKGDKEILIQQQDEIKQKLDGIIGQGPEEEDEQIELNDIRDQISMLKFEESLWENKIK